MNMGRSSANHQNCGTFTHAYCYSHLSCIRQITRKLPRVCQPLDSQLASQTYMYFIIEREHKLGYPCFYAIMLCFVKTAKVAKRLGLRPRPRWGSLQRSPVPPNWARGGYAPSCSHPRSYSVPPYHFPEPPRLPTSLRD